MAFQSAGEKTQVARGVEQILFGIIIGLVDQYVADVQGEVGTPVDLDRSHAHRITDLDVVTGNPAVCSSVQLRGDVGPVIAEWLKGVTYFGGRLCMQLLHQASIEQRVIPLQKDAEAAFDGVQHFRGQSGDLDRNGRPCVCAGVVLSRLRRHG